MIEKEDAPLILALAQDGMLCAEIADKFDVEPSDIRKLCSEYGVKVKARKPRERSIEEITDIIRKMVKSGRYSQKYIAEAMNVDRRRVLAVQVEFGLAIDGKVMEARKARMINLSRQVQLLRRDGMNAIAACKAVGISHSSYIRNVKALV